MPLVRMMIEDYDLMAHARRAFLGWIRGLRSQGIEPAAVELRAATALEQDLRLESAVLMDWDSSPHGDLGWVVALRWMASRVAEDVLLPSIPEAERARYLQGRREAIQRTISKLAATALTS